MSTKCVYTCVYKRIYKDFYEKEPPPNTCLGMNHSTHDIHRILGNTHAEDTHAEMCSNNNSVHAQDERMAALRMRSQTEFHHKHVDKSLSMKLKLF